ncbi:hypothetical protein H5410_004083 [Solanum commersonii]|uniref:Uncharacterized protein n=1 Tax=Solanum commersonii TaxID=4109 RepID=A0A9J6B6M6_SOLCO|nr:hypothetical protein H5410_004083 [Solanum commersonii]
MKSGSHTQYRLSQIPQLPSKASGSEQRVDSRPKSIFEANLGCRNFHRARLPKVDQSQLFKL